MAATTDIGIDLGTSSILVYAKGKGIVLKEPSVVAYDKDADKVRAIGEEARQMIGRTPGNIMAVRPMRQGVITDFLITERMLRYFIQKAMGRRAFRKPRISICVPSGVTEVERKAVEEATYQAGAREVLIVPEPETEVPSPVESPSELDVKSRPHRSCVSTAALENAAPAARSAATVM